MKSIFKQLFKVPNSFKFCKSFYAKNDNSEFSKEYIESLYDEWTDYLEKDETVVEKSVIEPKQINYTRGLTGVFDLEDLVVLLKEQYVKDIFCVTVPAELNYSDYLVIGTCKAKRHLISATELINKIYKKKKNLTDPFLLIEGIENESKWVAVDMRNIVLHLFLPETREMYDLESLWSIGEKYDDHSQKILTTQNLGKNLNVDWELIAKQAMIRK